MLKPSKCSTRLLTIPDITVPGFPEVDAFFVDDSFMQIIRKITWTYLAMLLQ
jgi:hypothetical protein